MKLFARHHIFYAYCDQCMIGLADPEGVPTKKPTLFVASAECLIRRLRLRCNGEHKHALLAGSVLGISRCKFAQVWPRRLVEKLASGVMECIQTKHVSAYPVGPAPVCKGCRAHAHKSDPRHTRELNVCAHPYEETVTWDCPACKLFRASTHSGHSWDADCQWTTAPQRARGYERLPNPLKDPKIPANVKPSIAPAEHVDEMPPPIPNFKWYSVDDLELITALDVCRDRDGWHSVLNDPALMQFNARALRFPQPRFDVRDYPFRSTYAFLPDNTHARGNWWRLESWVRYAEPEYEGRKSFGYPIPVLVSIFHRQRDPKEKETRPSSIPDDSAIRGASAGASVGPALPPGTKRNPLRDLMDKWDEEEGEAGAPEPIVSAVEPVQEESNILPEWSSYDLGASLRALRSDSEALQNRALRRLHLRWWHATASRMKSLLQAAGVPGQVLKLVDPIVQTCAICRMWAKPGHRSITTTRFAENFNQAVQCDLLFIEEHVILHMIDEAIRWTATALLSDRNAETILKAITKNWIKLYGPMSSLVSDQEGGLTSEACAVWAEKWKIDLRLKAKGQHAVIVERHHAILRDHVHKILAQARTENLIIDFEDILSEATFVKNAMLQVSGTTPYIALLGRFPQVLAEFESQGQSSIQDATGRGSAASRHSVRLREISVSAIAESRSHSRLRLAESSKSRLSGELNDYRTGEMVEVYRQPQSKDLTGWRGPAEVTDVSTIERGNISVRWGGRTMSVRLQDVRRVVLFVGLTDEGSEPLFVIRQYLLSMTKDIQTFGWIFDEKGWNLTRSAVEQPLVFKALWHVARIELGIVRVVAARIGRGVFTLHGLAGFELATLFWWPASQCNLYKTFEYSASQTLDLKPLFQLDEGSDMVWVQFLAPSTKEARRLRRRNPDVPMLGEDPDDPEPPGPDSDWEFDSNMSTTLIAPSVPPSPMSTSQSPGSPPPPWQPPPGIPPPPPPWQPPDAIRIRHTDVWKHPVQSDKYGPRAGPRSGNSFRSRSDREPTGSSVRPSSIPSLVHHEQSLSLPTPVSSLASTIKASSPAVSTPGTRSPALSERFVPSHRREASPSSKVPSGKRSNIPGPSESPPASAPTNPTSNSASSSSWQTPQSASIPNNPTSHTPLLPFLESDDDSENALPGDEFF